MSNQHLPASFSNVSLTLISIVVALAIEHLLGQVSTLSSQVEPGRFYLLIAQSVAAFIVIGTFWLGYASQLMTAGWAPRFQDFFAPLLILTLLYYWILAVGREGPSWFYIAAVGCAIGVLDNRFGLPASVAAQLKTNSPSARFSMLGNVLFCFIALLGGITTQLGAVGLRTQLAIVCAMAVTQLVASWFHYKWWSNN